MTKPAVILMAYGSPDRLSDVPAYYADIRGGRPIRPELLDDLVARYRALGIDDSDSPSPLNAITEETRAALESELGITVVAGMRHWEPRIATAVDAAIERGHDLLLGLVLAPHWSTLSIAKYQEQFDAAVAGRAETRFVREWGAEPRFVAVLAERCRGALAEGGAHVVFTAHSLPARIVDAGDPYAESLLETSRLVADAAGLGDAWSFSFQSESPTGEPWLGPDILDHLDDLAAPRRGNACSSARSGSSPTTSRSAGTSTSRRAAARTGSGSHTRASRCPMRRRTSSAQSPGSSGASSRL